MAVRNQNWFDLNSARDYPLDDIARCTDDAGHRLPSHFLADLYLKYPRTAGQYAFLAGLTVSERIVTLVILAADNLDATTGTPIASVRIPRPVEPWRQYPVEAMYPGTGGWVVFGHGIEDEPSYSARFSSPSQSLFAPRAAKPYDELPIPDVGLLGRTQVLTGLVGLYAGNDLEIVKECRYIPGHPADDWETCTDDVEDREGRECIVIRLKNTETTASTRNVFEVYQSPCLQTPESYTCQEPAPIEYIGPVQPDCCGNITLKFRGCAVVSEIAEAATVDSEGNVTDVRASGGVVIDCGLGMLDACVTSDYLPDENGRLPNEYEDLCSVSEQWTSHSESFPDVPSGDSFSGSWSYHDEFSFSSSWFLGDYDFQDNFDADNAWWQVKAGHFSYEQYHGEGYTLSTHNTTAAATTNVVLLIAEGQQQLYHRKFTTVVRVDRGDFGTTHNAALLFNLRFTEDNENYTCYGAELDWDAHLNNTKMFRLAYFDGTDWATLERVSVPEMSLGHNYQITVRVWPRSDNGAWLLAEVVGLNDAVKARVGPIPVDDFGDNSAYCGLHTKRARACFTWFGISPIK